jgi:hypothetical protein
MNHFKMKPLKGSSRMFSMIALSLLANQACGVSPLLNHDVPNRTAPERAEVGKFEKKCNLSFPKQGLCADIDLTNVPKNSSSEGSVKIYFWNPNRADAMVNPTVNWKFTPWMSDMGHGTGKTEITQAKDQNGNDMPGVFVVSKLSFVMGGEWELFVVMEPTTRDPNKEPEQLNVQRVVFNVNE